MRAHTSTVRVGIIGVGNCASALVQGVEFYRNAPRDEDVPGLMHVQLGDYHVSDIEFTAAFDINRTKVGRDLSEAIFAEPNNTIRFSDVPELGVPVYRGMTHDGLGKYLNEVIEKDSGRGMRLRRRSYRGRCLQQRLGGLAGHLAEPGRVPAAAQRGGRVIAG